MKTKMLTTIFALAMMMSATAFAQNITTPFESDPVVTASNVPGPATASDAIVVRHLAYPIPTYDFLSLELEGQSYARVRIRLEDTAGNEIYELFKEVEIDPNYVGRFDMRNLENGVYFVIVEDEFGTELETIEVEKH